MTGGHPATAAAAPGQTALVRFRLTGEAKFTQLVNEGADIATRPRSAAGTVLADVVVDPAR